MSVPHGPASPVSLPIAGQQVTQIQIDHRLGLLLSGGGHLTIAGMASIAGQSVEPDRQMNVLAAIDLLWEEVVEAVAHPDGTLHARFASGRTVTVASDEEYEPWEFVDATGEMRVVSCPGGHLATWGTDPRS